MAHPETPEQGFRTEFDKIWGVDFRHLRYDVVVYYSFNDKQLFLESIRLEDDIDSTPDSD